MTGWRLQAQLRSCCGWSMLIIQNRSRLMQLSLHNALSSQMSIFRFGQTPMYQHSIAFNRVTPRTLTSENNLKLFYCLNSKFDQNEIEKNPIIQSRYIQIIYISQLPCETYLIKWYESRWFFVKTPYFGLFRSPSLFFPKLFFTYFP